MFKEKQTFKLKNSDKLIGRSEILNILWMNIIHSNAGDKRLEVFMKKGEHFKFKGLENIMLYPLVSDDSKICRINYSEFAKEVLKEIDNYRIINNSFPTGEIYRIIDINSTLNDRIKEEGDYLLASDGEPKFKISTASIMKGYRIESIKISSSDNKEFLNYIPNMLEENDFRYGVEIEISTLDKRNNILFETYKQILNPKKTDSK